MDSSRRCRQPSARASAIAVSAPNATDDASATREARRDDRTIARQLAAALDRALDLGERELAQRIADQAIRIACDHPLLAERLSRLRTSSGDFETALSIIDSCRTQPSSLRLLRVTCLLQLGRSHEAHSDLHRWASRASAPLQARLMLALLEWQAGDDEAAFTALQRNLKQIEDPLTLGALLLMAKSSGRSHMANLWAARLLRASVGHPHSAFLDLMLVSAGFAAPQQRLPVAPDAVATLATELTGREHVIPALVHAAQRAGDLDTARLLIDALTRGMDDLDDQPVACTALADLHDLHGEHDIAAAWRSRAVDTERESADVLASIGRHGVTPRVAAMREQAA